MGRKQDLQVGAGVYRFNNNNGTVAILAVISCNNNNDTVSDFPTFN